MGGQYGLATRSEVLIEALNCDETTFVICRPEQEDFPHYLASKLRNRYRSIEPITSDRLCRLAEDIQERTGMDRLLAMHRFANECLTAQQDFAAVLKAIQKGTSVRSMSRRRLHALAEQVVAQASFLPVASLFEFLEGNANPTFRRHQLWHEMRRALADVASGSAPTLVEAIRVVRNRGAVMGRRLPKRCISRTLLLKGLECEHAIIVDADSLDTKNLYVALTRGSQKLHILSREKTLWPTDARRSCPKCDSQLAPRIGKHGPFLGCSAYPTCRYTESLGKAQ